MDEAGVLAHRQRTFVDIAGAARGGELFGRLDAVAAQRPFAAGPALDEAVAPRSDHRARPDQAGGDVGDFRKLRVVAVAVDDRLLEIRMQRRFDRGEKAGAEQDAVGAERQRGDETAAVRVAAGRQHRDRRHRVDHHGEKRHAGHPADMAAALGTLRDNNVGACLCRAFGFRHGAGHVGDQSARLVRAVEIRAQILLGLRPGKLNDRRPQFERGRNAVLARREQQKIEPERFVGLPPDAGGAFDDLLGLELIAAECAEAAGVGHRRNQFGRRCRPHAAQRHGVLDLQQIADWGFDHPASLAALFFGCGAA